MAITVIDRTDARHTFQSGATTDVGDLGDLIIRNSEGNVIGRAHPAAWSIVGGDRESKKAPVFVA